MNIFICIAVSIYVFIALAASFILSHWLHVHRHQELGESWLNEMVFGIFLASAWPMSLMLMLLNDRYSEKDKTKRIA